MNESFRRCCGQAAGIAQALERGDWLALEGRNYRLQALLEHAREDLALDGAGKDETVEALRGLSEGIDLTLQSVRTSTRSELDRLKLLAPLLRHLAERGGEADVAVQ